MARRSPELACRWLQQTPQLPAIAIALRDLAKRGELDVPNPELAVIQFYALTVYRTLSGPCSGSAWTRRRPRSC